VNQLGGQFGAATRLLDIRLSQSASGGGDPTVGLGDEYHE
jgi:hypothetical protein